MCAKPSRTIFMTRSTVWKIIAAVGDHVDVEDEIMILESMKMEIPVEAPVAGTVTDICVEEAQSVKEGDLLARMNPD